MATLNISFDLSSDAGLADLNAFLASRSYLVGFNPTKADLAAAAIIGAAPDKETYPNVFRYVNHINSFKPGQTKKWQAGVSGVGSGAAAPAAAAAGAGAAPAKAANNNDSGSDSDSDDGDLFGDSDDDGAVDAQEVAAPAAKKKAKKKKIEKTQLTFYVNPSDADTPIAQMEAKIREIEIEGCRWGDAFGVEDIAFGLQRLHVQCCIVNDLVGVDQVTDAVQALEEVGSTAPGTMNRLG